MNNIKKDGCLVIPSENGKHESQWKKMRNDISIITFGLDKDADFRASNIKYKKKAQLLQSYLINIVLNKK